MNVRARLAVTVAVAGTLAVGAAGATAGGREARGANHSSATLSGYQEVPAISTRATGTFSARLADDEIRFVLRYRGIEGGDVQQAHIHFAQRNVNGGVSAFLCSNLDTPPADIQDCPATGGTVRGTIRAENVVGPAAQGISPRELRELMRAMRAGMTYANVHSETFPTGEIRGQIRGRR